MWVHFIVPLLQLSIIVGRGWIKGCCSNKKCNKSPGEAEGQWATNTADTDEGRHVYTHMYLILYWAYTCDKCVLRGSRNIALRITTGECRCMYGLGVLANKFTICRCMSYIYLQELLIHTCNTSNCCWVPLKHVTGTKYLAVIIDEKLSFFKRACFSPIC